MVPDVNPLHFRKTSLKDVFKTCDVYNSCQVAHQYVFKSDAYSKEYLT